MKQAIKGIKDWDAPFESLDKRLSTALNDDAHAEQKVADLLQSVCSFLFKMD